MQELTDDQLDGLFRKSAEEFDPPYDPAGWEAVKDQLDDRDRATFWKRLLPWGIPLLLLLLIGGTWYAYRNVLPTSSKSVSQQVTQKPPTVADNARNLPSTGNRKKQNEAVPATDSRPAEAPSASSSSGTGITAEKQSVASNGGGSERTELPELLSKSEGELSKNTGHDATKRPLATYREKTENGSESSVVRTTLTNSDKLAATTSHRSRRLRKDKTNLTNRVNGARSIGERGFTTVSESHHAVRATRSLTRRATKNSDGSVPLHALTTSGSDMPGNVLTAEPAESERMVFPSITELAIRQGRWAKLPALASREVVQPEPTEPVVVPTAQPVRGFSVRFAVSPDLSSIGLTNFSRPGTNVGLFLEYRIASRWSVQAGVIRSTKVYNASASQYDGEKYWPSWKVLPESVDGVCNVLDIPVNVRYDIALRPRLNNRLQPSRWFVNGGVTSYIMLQENYTNNFADPSNPHIYQNMWQESAKTGAYGFSQLNLSVGYERALSRRLSWQVEPFIKAPLKGVGLFKINLMSTGAFLSLRYKL